MEKKMNRQEIEKIFEIKESWELPQKAMEMLENDSGKLFRKIMETNPDLKDDLFRDYYQNTQGDREKLKQDFTPGCLGQVISEMAGRAKSIADICAGTGTLTIKMWQKNTDAFYHAEEMARSAIPLLLVNLAIRNMDAEVINGNSLTGDVFEIYRIRRGRCYGKIERSDCEYRRYDVVVMNPPYSFKWPEVDEYKEDIRFRWGIPPKNFADYAFLQHGYSLLKPDGKLYGIVATGILFRGGREKDIRKNMVDQGKLSAVVAMPEKLFLNTSIPVAIITLTKEPTEEILIIDAQQDYTKGAKQNTIAENDAMKLLQAWNKREEQERYSRLVKIEEIKENDYNLNVPRYIDKYIPEKLPPITEIVKGIQKTEKEIHKAEKELCGMLKQMYGTTNEAQKELNEVICMWEEILNGN